MFSWNLKCIMSLNKFVYLFLLLLWLLAAKSKLHKYLGEKEKKNKISVEASALVCLIWATGLQIYRSVVVRC